MKSEERRHLAENDLEQTLHRWFDRIEPYSNRIVVGIVVVTAIAIGGIIWFRSSRATTDEGWASLAVARTPEALLDVAKLYPDTTAAQWAELRAARQLYDRGVTESLSNRRASDDDFTDAKEIFTRLVNAKLPDELREIALDGLARTLEATSTGDTSQAIEAYETLIREFPDSALASYAEHRVDALKQPATQEFYAWFSKQSPKPIERPAPLDGSGTLPPIDLPEFDLNSSKGTKSSEASSVPPVGNPFETPESGTGEKSESAPASSAQTPPADPAAAPGATDSGAATQSPPPAEAPAKELAPPAEPPPAESTPSAEAPPAEPSPATGTPQESSK